MNKTLITTILSTSLLVGCNKTPTEIFNECQTQKDERISNQIQTFSNPDYDFLTNHIGDMIEFEDKFYIPIRNGKSIKQTSKRLNFRYSPIRDKKTLTKYLRSNANIAKSEIETEIEFKKCIEPVLEENPMRNASYQGTSELELNLLRMQLYKEFQKKNRLDSQDISDELTTLLSQIEPFNLQFSYYINQEQFNELIQLNK